MSTLTISSLAASAAETAHDAAEKASSGGGLPQMDPSSFPSQLFWLAVSFAFLYWVMSSFILPKIGGVIEERRDRIADDLDKAAEFKKEAEEAEATYQQALADAKARAQAIAAETRDALDKELASIQAEADQKAEESLAQAEQRITEMKEQATAKVREAAVDTTKAVIEALIDERPSDEAIAAAMPAAQ